ncbi:hypothetical protein HG536_0C01770 [Torulaspora globosa]|uniref:Uncharacterized protein n=1 Tax=Torulaspora globosa TaxID=48254 RepID=A0A7G3ZES3_9SACH|nr:uncharacterized protein HG536_0C01770 [Torulaspora globosa]QLL32009.1 hypothetical protein HG536_0C01770 [Torulaspora globosa]
MLIHPMFVYDRSMKCGIPMFNGDRLCGNNAGKTKEENLSVTPSMSSVISQIRKYGVGSPGSDEGRESNGEAGEFDEDASQCSSWVYGMKRKLSEETTTTMSTLGSEGPHPLAGDPVEEVMPGERPVFKGVSMADLDLESEWTADDIVQTYKPVYDRRIRRSSVDFAINHDRCNSISSSNVFYDNDKVELEQWPTSVESSGTRDTQELVLPNRRTRQRSLNPNFFKLYSMEISGRSKKLLPDISVDEHILVQMSCQEIRALDIQPSVTEQGSVSAEDIKLALITRKKLWSDMIHDQRQDLFGDSVPWNLKFVSDGDQSTDCKESSLVRVESELKPWLVDNEKIHHTMLKPCGKLKLGASSNAKEIQYVVKGWCDKRFAQ